MDRRKKLYFIAVVPPQEIRSKVNEIKEYFAERYNSQRALNSPPHITLQMPFKWREDKESRLVKKLSSFAETVKDFSLELSGFGFFVPRVVFIQVTENQNLDLLQQLLSKFVRSELKIINDRGERPFHPHLTVAFRDLRKRMFYEAKAEFSNKEFNDSFPVDDIKLLKHNGKRWEIFANLPFTQSQ